MRPLSDSARNFPWKVFARIALIQSLLVVFALGATGLGARFYFKQQFISQAGAQLRHTLQAFVPDIQPSTGGGWCAAHAVGTEFRFTLIRSNGEVICDSHHSAETMESHLSRPEVQAALQTGQGESMRASATLKQDMLYEALALNSSNLILRGAIPVSKLTETLNVLDTSILLFLGVLAVMLCLFAIWEGRSFVFPMARLLEQTRSLLEPGKAPPPESLGGNSYGEWTELETWITGIRRELEEKIEALTRERQEQATLMSAISDAIIAVDAEGVPLFYNNRFAVLFLEAQKQPGVRLWELFRDPEILGAFRDALTSGRPITVEAFPFDLTEGRKFFSVSVSPLRRPGGAVYGMVGVFHDVTELKRTEQIRIDFVANVSHELRTPLTAIKGYADTMQMDLVRQRAPEPSFVDAIQRNTERLIHLINDLLDLSAIESSDSIQRVHLDTKEFSSKVIQQMQSVFSSKDQEVSLKIEASSVEADPKRLEQVLINLLDNASKYTPVKGRIELSWASSASGHETLMTVSDTGPGIPTEHHGRLFERFYRVDKARSREMGGTGLGLAIVKHIMQRHGGSIWVESELGRGSRFICSFPF